MILRMRYILTCVLLLVFAAMLSSCNRGATTAISAHNELLLTQTLCTNNLEAIHNEERTESAGFINSEKTENKYFILPSIDEPQQAIQAPKSKKTKRKKGQELVISPDNAGMLAGWKAHNSNSKFHIRTDRQEIWRMWIMILIFIFSLYIVCSTALYLFATFAFPTFGFFLAILAGILALPLVLTTLVALYFLIALT